MALLTCEDCGNDVSDAAPACPSCGRPADGELGGRCLRCEEGHLVVRTGVHGPLEIVSVIVWSVAFLPIGLLLYFYLSSKAWCPKCRKRPKGVASPGSMIFLIIVGLYAAMWTVALVTGTAK